MDLEENIRIAAEVFADNQKLYESKSDLRIGFRSGAKSQASKDYWYNEFKRQKIQSDSGQDQSLRNQPLKPSECFHGKSEHQMIFGTGGGHTDEENELWQKQVIEPGYEEQRQYEQYIKDNPDRPISFNNWKYMVEHYPNEQYKWNELPEQKGWKEYQSYICNFPDSSFTFEDWKDIMEDNALQRGIPLSEVIEPFTWIDKDGFDVLTGKKEPDIANGKQPYYPYGTIQSDSLYGATKKDFDDATPKRIGIIGHVDHGSSCIGLRAVHSQRLEDVADMIIQAKKECKNVIILGGRGNTRKELHNIIEARIGIDKLPEIQSIVPIADIIPEPIISKQELLKLHDKAVERSITDETYRESRAWDIKKDKKVSHKRNNKRK